MTFKQLCKDFDNRKPQGEMIGEIPWFNIKWENGNDSVNDLLCRYLYLNGYEYLRMYNGDVWFLYHNIWKRCTWEVKDGWVHFYMCKFDGSPLNLE